MLLLRLTCCVCHETAVSHQRLHLFMPFAIVHQYRWAVLDSYGDRFCLYKLLTFISAFPLQNAYAQITRSSPSLAVVVVTPNRLSSSSSSVHSSGDLALL
ncbi:hypothetical protein CSKR_202396 [Clonorchis sinensis]|uniref:Uncharacterized protein n=1 Tax=Clonorchis sinensis TaxID=79923 RepID=A0A8T1MW50_CLOSI|nr:hypothetical protein CSKR_202396 [Clonorchis sinensis]